MECRVSVRIAATFCLALFLWGSLAHTQERVVLVASADSPIDSLTSFEVRKIYLGIEVMRAGRFIRPLRNRSTPFVESVFLQNIVGLTQDRYERRLLSNLLKFGAVRPMEFENVEQLKQSLRDNSFSVTYLLVNGDEDIEGLKVLRILWQEF